MQQSACAAGHVGIFFIISLTWVSAVSQVLVASVIGLHPFCRGGRETVILLVSIFPGSFHVRLSRSIQLCLLEVLLLLFNSCITPTVLQVLHTICDCAALSILIIYLSLFLALLSLFVVVIQVKFHHALTVFLSVLAEKV